MLDVTVVLALVANKLLSLNKVLTVVALIALIAGLELSTKEL